MTSDQQKLIEQYFVRVLGWRPYSAGMIAAGIPISMVPQSHYWAASVEELRKPKPDIYAFPPNIIDSFPEFKRWVIEPMRERGLEFDKEGFYVFWWNNLTSEVSDDYYIKDDNITEAAIRAALETVEVKGDETIHPGMAVHQPD